jgi:outer membrane protein OmpA-like peptidoglycan-associated protein
MARVIVAGFAVLLAMGLGGCLTTAQQTMQTSQTPQSRIDGEYAGMLVQQYDTMAALFSVNGRNDVAQAFAARAALATAGQWVEPEPIGDAEDLTDPREVLMMALTQVMNAENALWLARAQVNYDCWAIIREESCQSDFDKAMRSLTIPAEALQTQSVYFDADSSALSEDTRTKLMNIANMLRMNKMVDVRLLGSTDHPTRNKSLALRRAIAVRNILTQMGVATDRITVKDEDHGDTILSQQTPEVSADTQARRVDIVLEPVFGQVI